MPVTDLPLGTVTFLFTDVEGSTRLARERGDSWAALLADHRRALREASERFSGVEVDTQGDAMFIAFARASDAAAAALQGQRALKALPLRVRMGLHTGEPIVTAEGYAGIDVHHGARVMSAGHGGQVLVSQATKDLLADAFSLRDLGEHRLKDLTVPSRLYQLGDGEFPPLRTLHQTNLPITRTPLIGRERELAELADLLKDQRLVTLVGPGGTGKTRLSLQVAADAVEDFEDGVWWVPLAAVTDPQTVETAIVGALHADGPLVAHLRTQRALLLLDNFEQIVAAAPLIGRVLEAAPKVRILVTSREPLRIQGEYRYGVEPLDPDDAAALLIERARYVVPTFAYSDAVVQICRRLDALPLAIELAAARVAVMSADELLARLDRALPLLTGGQRDAPDRQRTLRATIEWSHSLLDDAERDLFRKIAVFAGGFTLEAAEAVCDGDLDLMQSLVDKSLVRRRWDSDRFIMLETIGQFATELLAAWPGREDLRQRHALYYLDVARSTNLNVETLHLGSRPELGLAEMENFRAALAWTIESGETPLGLELAISLENLWGITDPSEGIRWFAALFEHADQSPTVVRGRALRVFGGMNDLSGDQAAARDLYEAGLAIFDALGDDAGRARTLHRVALNSMRLGDLDRARHLAEQSLELHRKVGNRFGEAEAIAAIGAVARDRGDRLEAFEQFEQSARLVREIGVVWWEQGMLAELAALDIADGRLDAADRHTRDALEIAAQIRDRPGRIFNIGLMARIAAERGDHLRAGRLWGAIEGEVAGAPNGGWIRHRAENEARILDIAGPDFEAGRAEGRGWSLDEAVQLALS